MGTMVGQWFQKILFWDNALSLFSAVSKSFQSPTRLPEIYSQIRKPLSQRAQHRKSLDYQCFAGFFATGTMSKALSHCPSPFSGSLIKHCPAHRVFLPLTRARFRAPVLLRPSNRPACTRAVCRTSAHAVGASFASSRGACS